MQNPLPRPGQNQKLPIQQPQLPQSQSVEAELLTFTSYRQERQLLADAALACAQNRWMNSITNPAADHFGATAGVMVCFNRFMGTVENQRSKATFRDDSDANPVIQGFSVEDRLAGNPLNLPLYGYRRRGGRIGDQSELITSRNRAKGG